jgi:hypothetical protein
MAMRFVHVTSQKETLLHVFAGCNRRLTGVYSRKLAADSVAAPKKTLVFIESWQLFESLFFLNLISPLLFSSVKSPLQLLRSLLLERIILGATQHDSS